MKNYSYIFTLVCLMAVSSLSRAELIVYNLLPEPVYLGLSDMVPSPNKANTGSLFLSGDEGNDGIVIEPSTTRVLELGTHNSTFKNRGITLSFATSDKGVLLAQLIATKSTPSKPPTYVSSDTVLHLSEYSLSVQKQNGDTILMISRLPSSSSPNYEQGRSHGCCHKWIHGAS